MLCPPKCNKAGTQCCGYKKNLPVRAACKISEPLDNIYLQKSNNGRRRREKEKKMNTMLIENKILDFTKHFWQYLGFSSTF